MFLTAVVHTGLSMVRSIAIGLLPLHDLKPTRPSLRAVGSVGSEVQALLANQTERNRA